MQSRFNPLLLVSVLIGLASMAAVVPTWAFAPFAVTTAAAGLYLAYTRSGSTKPIDPDEDKIYDLGQCAYATERESDREFEVKEAKHKEALLFYSKNKGDLEKYWKQQVEKLFRGQDNEATPRLRRLDIVFSDNIRLDNDFSRRFPEEYTWWTNMNQAKKAIYEALLKIRHSYKH